MTMVDHNVPFFANTPDDTHCVQASLRMVLKYFQPEKDFTWTELEKISAKPEGKWTWPMAYMLWLQERGYEVISVDPFDYRRFADEGVPYLVELFNEEVARSQEAHSDIGAERKQSARFAEVGKYEQREPNLSEIKKYIEEGYLVIAGINSRKLNKREGYSGHAVVIKGVSATGLVLHDPGSPPLENREVADEEFEAAWAFPNDAAKNYIAIRK